MNIDDVVTQLRGYCPFFGGRVAGAADYHNGIATGTAWLEVPAAYVVPLDDDAADNDALNGLRQTVTERIGVVVNWTTIDRRGQTPAGALAAARQQIFAALLNWKPAGANAARGMAYAGGSMLDFDRARLFYQFDFTLETMITDADGWQWPDATLTEIDATSVQPAGTPVAQIDVTLPQS